MADVPLPVLFVSGFVLGYVIEMLHPDFSTAKHLFVCALILVMASVFGKLFYGA